jgi:hypothetical protein
VESVPAEPATLLQQALDALCQAEPQQLADCESIVDLHRQLARLDAVVTRATAAFDASRAWEPSGARTAAAWITFQCNVAAETARRRVQLGRSLRHMPGVEKAWLAGDMSDAHVATLAKAQHRACECFARDEDELVGRACQLSFRHFCNTVAYWLQRADPDGDVRDAKKQHDSRRVSLSQSFEGLWFLDGVLDPISGEIVANMLRKIEEELFAADWAEAKARVGEAVSVNDLSRTPLQRRADALVEMARRAGAVGPGARMPEPLFTTVVGSKRWDDIIELASGTVISPAALVPWLDRAWVDRVVFDGAGRVIDVGKRRRLFTGATRHAVQIRDRECYHPYCEERAEHGQVDHIVPYSEGGETIEANGRAACGFHNRLRNRSP